MLAASQTTHRDESRLERHHRQQVQPGSILLQQGRYPCAMMPGHTQSWCVAASHHAGRIGQRAGKGTRRQKRQSRKLANRGIIVEISARRDAK
jgi:hypothetical protein